MEQKLSTDNNEQQRRKKMGNTVRNMPNGEGS